MSAFRQLLAIVLIAAAAAAVTYGIRGAPSRTVACDPATLKPNEVCLQQIPADAEILWVDARLRRDWEKNGLPGSVLWNLDPAEDMQAFEAAIVPRVIERPKVVVYCGDENCGLSHQVAARIRALDLGAEVSVLRGGWSALRDAGRIQESK
jgi:rhodanese-related sulfurtransferase